jgi:hypothetical protein
LLILVVILNLSVFSIRIHSLLTQGDLTTTTGNEGPMIYGVWKASHHFPVYEDPRALITSNTLYNFMFYRAYALLPRTFGLDAQDLVLASRLTTAAWGLVGAAVGLLILSMNGLLRNKTALIWGASAVILFWFSTSPVGWFGLSVRPDSAAVCFAAVGLAFFLRFLSSGFKPLLLCSSMSFFLAWSFKQNIILTFAGTVAVIWIWRRDWKVLFAQIAPFAVSAITTLYVGGAAYRVNIVRVPALGLVNVRNALLLVVKAIVENPLLYLVPLAGFAVVLAAKTAVEKLTVESLTLVLGLIGLVALAGGAVFCLRVGSDRNYFFEAGMVGSLAVLPAALTFFDRYKSAGRWLVVCSMAVAGAISVVQLVAFLIAAPAQPPVIRGWSLSGKTEFGRLRLLSPAEEQDRRALANAIAGAPKPVLILDDTFSQPWHATGGKFPAFVVDPNVLADLRRTKIIPDDRIATLIELRRFRAVFLKEPEYVPVALASGYRPTTTLGGPQMFVLASP